MTANFVTNPVNLLRMAPLMPANFNMRDLALKKVGRRFAIVDCERNYKPVQIYPIRGRLYILQNVGE